MNMLRFKRCVVLALSLGLAGGSSSSLHSQESQGTTQKYLEPSQKRAYLRGTDGLASIAAVEGKTEIDQDEDGWWAPTLAQLADNSSLVVEGRIIKQSSELCDNGNNIRTKYTLQIVHPYKGNVSDQLTFFALGGMVSFPNGTTAKVKTVVSSELKLGSDYFLFFAMRDGELTLTAGSSGAIAINPANGALSSIGLTGMRNQTIRDDLQKFHRVELSQFLMNHSNSN